VSGLETPRSQFDEALRLLEAGDTAGAQRLCEAALQRFPDHVNLLGLAGAIALRLGQRAQAEQRLRRTVELAPGFAKPWEDLGTLLMQRGRAGEAATCLERAVRLDPQLELAHFNLGRALAQLGRGAEADAAFEASFALAPWRRALAEAAIAQREGHTQDAERAYRRVLQADPGNVDALAMLGRSAAVAGRAQEAERLLRRAIALAPDHLEALLGLARLLKDADRFEEAIEPLRRVLDLDPRSAAAHHQLGNCLAQLGQFEEAAAGQRRATELEPRHAGAWLGLGHALKTLGDYDGGVAAYRACSELNPGSGEPWWSLANLKTYRFDDAEIATLRARAQAPGTEEGSRVNFLFTLAKALEDRKDYAGAWAHYAEGNRRQRALLSYDPVQTELQNDAIVEVFDAAFFAARRGWGEPDRSPVFVLGLPRSGSTLVEQILASHSEVEGTAELPYIGRLTSALSRNRADGTNYPHVVRELDARHAQRLGAEYLARAAVHRRQGRANFIDKMPNNFPCTGFIHLILPNARIIDVRRAPLDACVANYRQLYARGQAFAYDLVELGEYYLQYLRLMDHWERVLPGRVLRVRYEDVVCDLEGQARRLLAWCDLPWQDACLRYWETERAVRTASSEQVRRPIYTDSVGQWRRYAEHLEPLREVLAPVLTAAP
jgi:tetratricopeptide (TPR) repeat protein